MQGTCASSSDNITSNDALWGLTHMTSAVILSEGGSGLGTVNADAIVVSEYDLASNAATASLTFTLNTAGVVVATTQGSASAIAKIRPMRF